MVTAPDHTGETPALLAARYNNSSVAKGRIGLKRKGMVGRNAFDHGEREYDRCPSLGIKRKAFRSSDEQLPAGVVRRKIFKAAGLSH